MKKDRNNSYAYRIKVYLLLKRLIEINISYNFLSGF